MKKVFATLLVALLVASTVFAGFTGSFETQYKADFAGKNYGFINGTTNKLELKFDKVLGGTTNDAAITGKIAAEIAPSVKDGNINLGLTIKEASINGENWGVDLAEMAEVGNYASDVATHLYIDDDGNPAFIGADLNAEVKTTNGVTVDYDGWKLGVGMNIVASKDEVKTDKPSLTVVKYDRAKDALTWKEPTSLGEAKSPDRCAGKGKVYVTYDNQNAINVLTKDDLTLKFKDDGKDVIYTIVPVLEGKEIPIYGSLKVGSKTANAVPGKKELAATFTMKELAFLEDSLKLNAYAGAYATSTKNVTLGFGANVAFAQDKISASVASDMVVSIAKKTTFDADFAAKFAYDFVNAGIYYATKGVAEVDDAPVYGGEDVLDIALGVDLASFEIPLALNFNLTDLVDKVQRAMAFDVTSAFMEGAKVSANYYHSLAKDDHTWMAGLAGEYNLENIAKFTAELKLNGDKEVTGVALDVAAENTTLIENTTLKLAYASKNFLDDAKAAGAVTASVKVAF